MTRELVFVTEQKLSEIVLDYFRNLTPVGSQLVGKVTIKGEHLSEASSVMLLLIISAELP